MDGATAEVSFNLNFAGGAQNFLSGDPGEGTPFAIDAWRQATLGFFKEMQDGIRATSTLGKTAADDGKKKAKQIESALHSVESEQAPNDRRAVQAMAGRREGRET